MVYEPTKYQNYKEERDGGWGGGEWKKRRQWIRWLREEKWFCGAAKQDWKTREEWTVFSLDTFQMDTFLAKLVLEICLIRIYYLVTDGAKPGVEKIPGTTIMQDKET